MFGILTGTVGGLSLQVVSAVRAAGRKAFVASLASGECFSAAGIFRCSGCGTRGGLISWNINWAFLRDECRLLIWQMLSSRINRLIETRFQKLTFDDDLSDFS